mgnify:CR=1 FL=1
MTSWAPKPLGNVRRWRYLRIHRRGVGVELNHNDRVRQGVSLVDIQIRDEANHKIVAKLRRDIDVGLMGLPFPAEMNLIVEARDGRFRMTARDFVIKSDNTGRTIRRATSRDYDDIEADLDELRFDLKQYIQAEAAEEDW